MAKGWNREYLKSMIDKYENLENMTQDEKTKLKYNEIKGLYELLFFRLLSQQGEVFYDKVTTEEFLSDVNGINNSHFYPKYYERLLNKFSLEIESLPRIVLPKYRRKISKDESFDIVGDFIKRCFDDELYKIYKANFLENQDYILFDHADENPDITFVADEAYIALVDYDDIRFTSSLAHEAGHIAKFAINKDESDYCLLGEFESFSYQIRLLMFMINNGIYKRDALKELLDLMVLTEQMLIGIYYNNKYKLSKIKDPNYFDAQIEKLNLKEKTNIKAYTEVYDIITTALVEDNTMYIYSLLATLGELTNSDYLQTYYDVITNIGKIEHKKLVRRNNISVNRGIKNYLELRSELTEML